MASKFPDTSVAEALERSIRNAKHLRAVHSALVGGARALAREIDEWDTLVRWAQEDAGGRGRPAVPQHNNTALPTLLKYCEALRIAPDEVAAASSRGKSVSPVERMKRERAARQKKVG